jgi:hypothetical protein
MPSRTIYIARLLGFFCVLVALSMLTHRQATVDLVTALLHNQPLIFTMGLIATATGLAIVLGHNLWSGGALPVVVTLVGWVTLAKGILFLFLSPGAESGLFLDTLHYPQLFYLYSSISLILGIYLIYLSYASTRPRNRLIVTDRIEVSLSAKPPDYPPLPNPRPRSS